MIDANSGGYDNFALVRFSQVSLQNRHQLIWTCHFGCCYGTKSHTETFGPFAFAFCSTAYTPVFFSISMTNDRFVLLDKKHCRFVGFPFLVKALCQSWRMPTERLRKVGSAITSLGAAGRFSAQVLLQAVV